ncbi:MAG: hypothetical protein IH851_11000 [Armatimonadetes bacterium]|nr:hypothetical protein [Armatimonadota bacterium]
MNTINNVLPGLAKLRTMALIVGVAGLALLAAGYFRGDPYAPQSYLVGYYSWLVLTLGCLCMAMLHHLVRARWGFPIIRFFEAGTKLLPLMALLFVPILFMLPQLYDWARPEVVAQSEVLQRKAPFLNVPFFTVRAAVFFAFWIGLAHVLYKWSREEDRTGDPSLANKRANLSAPGTALFVLVCSFAVTDWVMSLEEHWYSTIFGLMFVIGQALTALALATAFLTSVADREPFSEFVTERLLRDLGNLLLTLVILWAYMSFAQYLIIWSGNLREEITYFVDRREGAWQLFGIALVFLHFMLPFFLLLSSHIKRSPKLLRAVAIWILVFRVADMLWTVIPSFHRTGVQLHWMDAAAFLGIGGLWVWVFARQLQRSPLLPRYGSRRAEVAERA